MPEKLSFKREDFINLTIDKEEDFGERLRNRLDSEPCLSEDKIKKLIFRYNARYANDLDYWISLFFAREKTAEYASMIIKYLIVHGNAWAPIENQFDFISYTELNKKLVESNGVGRNKKINENKIPHRRTLSRILEVLVESEILVKEEKVDKFPRTKPTKEKKTSYYRINGNKIFWTFYRKDLDNILGEHEDREKLSYKELHKKLQSATLDIVILFNRKYNEARMLHNFYSAKIIEAERLLMEHGIRYPEDEIMDRIKKRDPGFYDLMNKYNPQIYGNPLSDLYSRKNNPKKSIK